MTAADDDLDRSRGGWDKVETSGKAVFAEVKVATAASLNHALQQSIVVAVVCRRGQVQLRNSLARPLVSLLLGLEHRVHELDSANGILSGQRTSVASKKGVFEAELDPSFVQVERGEVKAQFQVGGRGHAGSAVAMLLEQNSDPLYSAGRGGVKK